MYSYLLCTVSTSVLHVCTRKQYLVVYHVHVYLFSYFSRLLSLPYKIFYSSIPTLPAGWADQTTTTPLDTIQLCKVSRAPCTASQPLVVTCCLMINSDFTWQVHIHGHTITPTARSPLSSVPEKLSTVSATALTPYRQESDERLVVKV